MIDERDNGCLCHGCGKRYRVDLMIPDRLWEKIKPSGKPVGTGLLCGRCIMDRIEAIGEFGCLTAVEV